jgi:RNA polymerase sigma factor (sigma-70 family)
MWRRSPTDLELAAIETVYREQLGSFVRLATAITGDEQTALDAVHDAFVRAVRYRGRLRDREAAAGWVCRIVLNEARKRSSVERRRASAPVEAADEPATNGHHDAGVAAAALASLPERQRLALFLRYYADLDYAGIAEALGISRGTVSATLHAAHSNLQTKLKEVKA